MLTTPLNHHHVQSLKPQEHRYFLRNIGISSAQPALKGQEHHRNSTRTYAIEQKGRGIQKETPPSAPLPIQAQVDSSPYIAFLKF